MRKSWGIAIRQQREFLGMTQKSLADAVNVHQSAVSMWEGGTKTPTVDRQLAIARALKVHPQVLFSFPDFASEGAAA